MTTGHVVDPGTSAPDRDPVEIISPKKQKLQSKSNLYVLFVAAAISRDGFVDEPKSLVSQLDYD